MTKWQGSRGEILSFSQVPSAVWGQQKKPSWCSLPSRLLLGRQESPIHVGKAPHAPHAAKAPSGFWCRKLCGHGAGTGASAGTDATSKPSAQENTTKDPVPDS